jgi:hypothetical protein
MKAYRECAQGSKLIAVVGVVALLSACASGGGVTATPAASPVRAFASFETVQPGQTDVKGMSQTVSAKTDMAGNVLSRTVNAVDFDSTVQLRYDDKMKLTGINIITPQSTATWHSAEITCDSVNCTAKNALDVGAAINAMGPIGWNYQTFGWWYACPCADERIAGVISVGNATPVNGIPVGGSATYNGRAGGLYLDGSGAAYEHRADMTANADFTARSIDFHTANSQITPLAGGASTATPGLDLTGTLAIASGANQFSGTITSPAVSGTATGRFYGPTAQEIGGVFTATGTGVQTLVGGFGGKK